MKTRDAGHERAVFCSYLYPVSQLGKWAEGAEEEMEGIQAGAGQARAYRGRDKLGVAGGAHVPFCSSLLWHLALRDHSH